MARYAHWFIAGLIPILYLPNAILLAINWDYTLASAPFWQKLHPSTYLIVGLLCLLPLWQKRSLDRALLATILPRPLLVYSVAVLTLMVFAIAIHGMGNLSFIIDSLLRPVMMLMLLLLLSASQQAFVFRSFIFYLTANALLALLESTVGFRVFPLYIGGIEITYERRATALLGHPLANAMATAYAILLLWGVLVAGWWRTLAAGLMLLAMVAFGGRMALLLLLLCGFIYVAWIFFHKQRSQTLYMQDLVVAAGAVMVLPLLTYGVLFYTEFGQNTLARFTWEGSAQTRLTMFGVLDYLQVRDWLLGLPNQQILDIMRLIDLPRAIESMWLVFLLRFGLIMLAVFMAAFFGALLRWLWQGQPVLGKLAIVLYVFMISVTNSLSAKEASLTYFCLAVFTARAAYKQHKSTLDKAGQQHHGLAAA